MQKRTAGIKQPFLSSSSIHACPCEQVETVSMCGTNSPEQPCQTYGYVVHVRPTGTKGAVFNSMTDQRLQRDLRSKLKICLNGSKSLVS